MNATLLFDRARVKWQRQRFAGQFASVDFLLRETAGRLTERLQDVAREFSHAVLCGPHTDILEGSLKSTRQIKKFIHGTPELMSYTSLLCDEEWLPFRDSSLDLFISNFSLHWINDLPGTLVQIRRALKQDGLFLAVMPGPKTLQELRASLEQAMVEIEGGIRPVISPFVEVRDAGNLLQRTGYGLPVTDSETVTLTYTNPFDLMRELRFMGEANALVSRKQSFSRRDVFQRAAAIYKENHTDKDGRIKATVELVFLSGWKPAPNQQKPAARGSGQIHMNEALN
ncbi:MAG: methyltransferase domain-containing protein [Rickettsiales bacterium]